MLIQTDYVGWLNETITLLKEKNLVVLGEAAILILRFHDIKTLAPRGVKIL